MLLAVPAPVVDGELGPGPDVHVPHQEVGDVTASRHGEHAVGRLRVIGERKHIRMVGPPHALRVLRVQKGLVRWRQGFSANPLTTECDDLRLRRERVTREHTKAVNCGTREHNNRHKARVALHTPPRGKRAFRDLVVTGVGLSVEEGRL